MKVELQPQTYPVTRHAWCERCKAPLLLTLESDADRQTWITQGVLCPACTEVR